MRGNYLITNIPRHILAEHEPLMIKFKRIFSTIYIFGKKFIDSSNVFTVRFNSKAVVLKEIRKRFVAFLALFNINLKPIFCLSTRQRNRVDDERRRMIDIPRPVDFYGRFSPWAQRLKLLEASLFIQECFVGRENPNLPRYTCNRRSLTAIVAYTGLIYTLE